MDRVLPREVELVPERTGLSGGVVNTLMDWIGCYIKHTFTFFIECLFSPPDNVLWQLMMLPILMPLWIIDIIMSILTSPLTVLRRIMTYTEALPTTPPPIRRRGSMSLHSGGGHKPHVYPVSPMAMNMYSGSPPSPPLGGPLYLDPSLY